MASVSSVTHTSDPVHLSKYAMSAISGHIKDDVSFVEDLGSQMRITARSAVSRKKIEMDALK